jgi:hypothetical protein
VTILRIVRYITNKLLVQLIMKFIIEITYQYIIQVLVNKLKRKITTNKNNDEEEEEARRETNELEFKHC